GRVGMYECRSTAVGLGIGHGVQSHGGRTGGLRPVDLHHATARQSADPEGNVQGDRSGRDHRHRRAGVVTEAHHRPLAERPVDLTQRRIECFAAVCNWSSHAVTFLVLWRSYRRCTGLVFSGTRPLLGATWYGGYVRPPTSGSADVLVVDERHRPLVLSTLTERAFYRPDCGHDTPRNPDFARRAVVQGLRAGAARTGMRRRPA